MIERFKLVRVMWDDSKVIHDWHGSGDGYDTVAHCATVGFLTQEEKTIVTLALTVSEDGTILETITIPRGCITKIDNLRVR